MFKALKKLFNSPDTNKKMDMPANTRPARVNAEIASNRKTVRQKESPVRKVWIDYHHNDGSVRSLEKVTAEYDGQYPEDMHFVYLTLLDYHYPRRENKTSLNKCIKYCQKDMDIYEEFKREYTRKHDYFVNYPTFKQLAIIYEKSGEFQKAIEVCDRALSLGVECDTKAGFKGRKTKLLKKLDKANTQ